MRPSKSTSWFTSFAKWTARATGRPATFALAAATIVVWAATGPLFKFSDTWQLVINTGTPKLNLDERETFGEGQKAEGKKR